MSPPCPSPLVLSPLVPVSLVPVSPVLVSPVPLVWHVRADGAAPARVTRAGTG